MKCSACQKDVPDGAKFCPWCGKEPLPQKIDAAWVAGMQEEINETRRAGKSLTAAFITSMVVGSIILNLWIAWPIWFQRRDTVVLIIAILMFVLAVSIIPFIYRYTKKREQLIKKLKDGGG